MFVTLPTLPSSILTVWSRAGLIMSVSVLGVAGENQMVWSSAGLITFVSVRREAGGKHTVRSSAGLMMAVSVLKEEGEKQMGGCRERLFMFVRE